MHLISLSPGSQLGADDQLFFWSLSIPMISMKICWSTQPCLVAEPRVRPPEVWYRPSCANKSAGWSVAEAGRQSVERLFLLFCRHSTKLFKTLCIKLPLRTGGSFYESAAPHVGQRYNSHISRRGQAPRLVGHHGACT